MDGVRIRDIHIEHVCHLRDVDISLEGNDGCPRHLIITGENGSGKTSLLDAIAGYLDAVCRGENPLEQKGSLEGVRRQPAAPHGEQLIESWVGEVERRESILGSARQAVEITFNMSDTDLRELWEKGDCVLAHFPARRSFEAIVPRRIEKVSFAECYGVEETPQYLFVSYLLDLKMTQALAMASGRKERADEIGLWLDRVRDILREVYEDSTLELTFDEETFRLFVSRQGHEPQGLNEASDGLSAVLDIIAGLMLRMVGKKGRATDFDLPGIALIDEIEAHQHLSLQRRVLPILTHLFPNVQFIVSTHSPFVLSSVGDVAIFDLGAKAFVWDGLEGSAYESVVEGYFDVDTLSRDLREKYDRYRELSAKETLVDGEYLEACKLELSHDAVPDFLALGIAAQYQKAKLELHGKAARR